MLLGGRERLEAAAPDLAGRIRELKSEIDACK
jgi:Sec-independent protein translocase protein TatA